MVRYDRAFIGQNVLCAKLWNADKFQNSYKDNELNEWWAKDQCVKPPFDVPSEYLDRQQYVQNFNNLL